MISQIDNRDSQSLTSNQLNEILSNTYNNDSDDSSSARFNIEKKHNKKSLIENLNQAESNSKPVNKSKSFIKGLKLIVLPRSDTTSMMRKQSAGIF